jgi:hypothetical protein
MIRTYGLYLSTLCLLLIAFGGATTQGQQAKQDDLRDSGNFLSYTHVNNPSKGTDNDPPLLRPSPALIIRNFIAAETKFRKMLVQFSFKRDVVLQTIGGDGEVTGEYLRDSVFVLDDRGQRVERVVFHPKPTIKEMTITKEDIQDLAGSQLFGLELADLNAYNFSYLGDERLKGQRTYLVAVSPKQEPDPRQMRSRFFVGQIWLDPVTFQAVQLRGITEPHGKQRFPVFETMRDIKVENLSFPSATSADDVLRFPHKAVRYRIKVRYYDFKRFASRVKILEQD